jgi:hypothetical protein
MRFLYVRWFFFLGWFLFLKAEFPAAPAWERGSHDCYVIRVE